MATKKPNQRRKASKTSSPRSIDPADKMWCYVLMKLFTSILEDPEEAKKFNISPSKVSVDVDLEGAAAKLQSVIRDHKSHYSFGGSTYSNDSVSSSRSGANFMSLFGPVSHESSTRFAQSSSSLGKKCESVESKPTMCSKKGSDGDFEAPSNRLSSGQDALLQLVLKAMVSKRP